MNRLTRSLGVPIFRLWNGVLWCVSDILGLSGFRVIEEEQMVYKTARNIALGGWAIVTSVMVIITIFLAIQWNASALNLILILLIIVAVTISSALSYWTFRNHSIRMHLSRLKSAKGVLGKSRLGGALCFALVGMKDNKQTLFVDFGDFERRMLHAWGPKRGRAWNCIAHKSDCSVLLLRSGKTEASGVSTLTAIAVAYSSNGDLIVEEVDLPRDLNLHIASAVTAEDCPPS